ncbi:MAG: tRNA (adenosine(37)-N6)-threonylcarbamoyltransferase complex ATPase subunit type 1 TsaE [Prevotellaceae bacterium]|jgi:tRNA threonylcarbamoyladenosine biosynthesis protein TsaE|nr:tRNA (adenosine(37)-N6)-threonylcarbamoyltransferase complex ATPase subunit type 1 TsaE [Prevotellaceae bacterium]
MTPPTFTYTLAELPAAAAWLLAHAAHRRVLAFYGGMGAGKTTLIKALCRALRVADNVTSPTFALINEYRTEEGGSVFHFDFYRIAAAEEACDLGCGEYFDSGAPCLVEWPERVEALLPPEALRVSIAATGGEESPRVLTINN